VTGFMQAVASAGRDRGFRGWRFGMSDPESVENAKKPSWLA
jgi:hypothetical protein